MTSDEYEIFLLQIAFAGCLAAVFGPGGVVMALIIVLVMNHLARGR